MTSEYETLIGEHIAARGLVGFTPQQITNAANQAVTFITNIGFQSHLETARDLALLTIYDLAILIGI